MKGNSNILEALDELNCALECLYPIEESEKDSIALIATAVTNLEKKVKTIDDILSRYKNLFSTAEIFLDKIEGEARDDCNKFAYLQVVSSILAETADKLVQAYFKEREPDCIPISELLEAIKKANKRVWDLYEFSDKKDTGGGVPSIPSNILGRSK